ncbi:hypothetical protein PMN64_40520 [Bradyrhizobium sp. UFLA01-814]|uniref:DUF7380 domain-containing protein n=1 Tax=Bradyrhizobium sp. UFLA01-814 TaxID=3023480 RepID=UPI00398BB681
MNREIGASDEASAVEQTDVSQPVWLQASLADLEGLAFESPIAASNSADSRDLGDLFRAAADKGQDGPAVRMFRMLSAAAGMMLRSKEKSEPFGPMAVFADGRRSPIQADFRGPLQHVLEAAADLAKHPALKARLADLCWSLDRKKGRLALAAIAAYVDIVKGVDDGSLVFKFDKGQGALKHDARDHLRRALQIGKAVGWDKPESMLAREVAVQLRGRAMQKALPNPAFWFSDLDLDFGISDPAVIGKDIETLIAGLPSGSDGHGVIDLWRLAARAYHLAKNEDDKHRAQTAAAEQFVLMAEGQPMAMLASSLLSDAISELHGVPGKKDRRRELRHRLIDVQAGIAEEMSPFSYPLDLEDIAREVERTMDRPTLRDKFFVFAALDQSPDPAKLAADASQSIREHPLSSLFGASHHDREGKVVHRTDGGGLGDGGDESAIRDHIARHESIRRQITVSGQIEVARQSIARDHLLSDDVFAHLLIHSPFVPSDLVRTFSRGFLRFFQGDFVSGLYILTPLLESSLRHLLKANGHDVTIFDDSTQTQQDRTISSLFEQMRGELSTIFGSAIMTDIEGVFLKKPGPYLRHALSHGLLHDGDPYGHDAIYSCWLIFRLCLLPLFPYRDQLHLPFDEPAHLEPA